MQRSLGMTILGLIVLGLSACGDKSKEGAKKAPGNAPSDAPKDLPKNSPKLDVYSVEGQFSVETPPGFHWVEVQKVDAGAVKGRVCACTKDGSTARLVLTVEERTATGDAPRIATLKAHYNGLIQTLQGGGFTELKGSRPGITAPIPDRASFEVLGKNAEGKPFFVKSVTVFGKGIYLFQAFADSKEEADPLAKVAESLKELDPQGK